MRYKGTFFPEKSITHIHYGWWGDLGPWVWGKGKQVWNQPQLLCTMKFRCKRCKDGIAREKLRAVKGKGSTRQLLHPSCFFQWLRDQILGKEVTQVFVGGRFLDKTLIQYSILKVYRPTKVLGSFMTPWRPMAARDWGALITSGLRTKLKLNNWLLRT